MLALSVWGWGWVTAEISSDVNSFDFSAYYTLFLLLTSLGGKTVRWSAGFKKERRGPRVGQCTGPSRRPGELLEQRAPEGWALWYRAVLEQCLESCGLWKPVQDQCEKDGIHGRETMWNSGREAPWRSDRDGALCPDHSPHFPFPCATLGRDIGKSGTKKWSWAWEGGGRVNLLEFCFSWSYSICIWQ